MAKQIEWVLVQQQWFGGIAGGPGAMLHLWCADGIWRAKCFYLNGEIFKLTATTAEGAKAEAIELVSRRVAELCEALGMKLERGE